MQTLFKEIKIEPRGKIKLPRVLQRQLGWEPLDTVTIRYVDVNTILIQRTDIAPWYPIPEVDPCEDD